MLILYPLPLLKNPENLFLALCVSDLLTIEHQLSSQELSDTLVLRAVVGKVAVHIQEGAVSTMLGNEGLCVCVRERGGGGGGGGGRGGKGGS